MVLNPPPFKQARQIVHMAYQAQGKDPRDYDKELKEQLKKYGYGRGATTMEEAYEKMMSPEEQGLRDREQIEGDKKKLAAYQMAKTTGTTPRGKSNF